MPQDSRIRARAPRTSSATPLDADQAWRTVCDEAPDAMVIFDAAGIVRGFNVAAARLFGHRPQEIVGKPLERFLPPDEGGIARLVSECLSGNEEPSVEPREVRLLAHGGTAIPAEGTLGVAETPEGELYILQLRDAASRKGLEFALLETEERLAGLTANLPGIVFQRVMRADGRFYYPFFTTGVRDVLGFEPEEMRVNSEGCLDTVHWADRGPHMAAIRHSAACMTPCLEEFRAITRTGEVRWLRGTSRPQRLAEGDILWDGVLLDVTDRKRAEIRLEMIMDHAADSIITVDEGGRIESVNAAAVELFGHAGRELIGRNISVLMPEPYRSRHEASMMRYIATGEGDLIGQGPRELLGLRKDGSSFPLELSTSEVRMEGRRIFVGIGRDVTLRKQTEAALRETEQRLRGIAANLPGIVFQRVLKADGSLHYAYVSEGCLDVLGVDPADLMADASLFLAAMPPEDRRTFMEALHHSARTLDPFDEEVRIAVRDGGERWLRGQSRPRLADNGDVVWDGVALDVTDRKEAEERLRFLAYHDPLTGVANRALFHERFNQARLAAQRTRSRIAVLSLGIDRFSIINTTLGHAIGDEVLRAAADRLRGCVKDDDVVARAGGDRFLVMLGGVKNDSAVNDVVDIIMASSAEPLVVRGEELDLTASIGIALYPRDGEDAATLVKNADAALLLAKGQGAGSVQFFTQEMNARALKTLSLQNRLRRALENEEFVPYYQPQVDLASGRVVGTEALARWISPELGIVPPAEFIPVAEEYGLIDGICEQMLRATCRQNRAWQDAGLPAISVAVNLSGRQFQNPRRLVQALETVLAESGLPAQYLELELTESSAMRDPDMAVGVMRMIKEEMGIGCSIDDFGTGYSSLSVLKRFPLQKLKIDRSFVADVTSDANDAAIVDAIIAMAHALRLKVVAEGVETVEHLEFLRRFGCDQIQGYLFSRPLPAADLEALLVEGRSLAPTPARPLTLP